MAKHPLRRPVSGARLQFESLESRRLLALTVIDDNWAPGNGGAIDLNSGLVWSAPAYQSTGSVYSQGGANSWANQLVEGGKSDWRLATRAELEEAAAHSIATHVDFTGGGGQFWSWTKAPENNKFWAVNLWSGLAMSWNKASLVHGIAVRGTRSPAVHTTPDVRVFTAQVELYESGGAGRFTLALDTQPTANVTIPLLSSDASEGAPAVASVTFTPQNWNVPQWVLVNSADDSIVDGSQSFSIELLPAQSADPNYNNLDGDDLPAVTVDNDVASIVLAYPGAGPVSTSEAGAQATVAVTLTAAPANGPVYVQLASSDTTEGTAPAAPLVFDATNWNVPQHATITGVADGIADGDVAYAVQGTVVAGSAAEFLGIASNAYQLTNADVNGGVAAYASGALNKTIPDKGSYTATINVPAGATIGDLNVSVNVAHTFAGHARLTLIGPDGRSVMLVDRRGGSGDNFTGTTFDDEAQQSILDGAAPFTGSFRPQTGSLSQWEGRSAGGTWKLKAEDVLIHFGGTLLNWSLKIRAVGGASAAAAATPSQLAAAAAAMDAAYSSYEAAPPRKLRRLRIA